MLATVFLGAVSAVSSFLQSLLQAQPVKGVFD